MDFDFQEQTVIAALKERKVKKALLQLPEGIKKEAVRLANLFERETSTEIIVSGETCWGGCDLALEEAQSLGVDLLIHYGHAPFIKKADFPVLYIEMQDAQPINHLLKKSDAFVSKDKRIGIVASIQHLHQLEEAKQHYEALGKEVFIPLKKGYAAYDGHVVGCEYNSLKLIKENVDSFIVIGNQFHSLGAALSVQNPVYLIDVYNQEVVDMTALKDKVIKQRLFAINKLKDASKVGIIVGLKPGQQFGKYNLIKKKFQDQGKQVVLITMREMTNDKLLNFYDINAFVELACPRIAIEDYSKYERAILTFREAQVALGELKWEDLIEHGFL
ncbi:MAG: diphthamide biosynthesis enzyme Dph2 [Candidatus Nanoarchaeia archaeon]